jgi:hypothetical protein
MELTKSIVIRVGEPVPLSDFSNSNDIRCSNTYFLNPHWQGCPEHQSIVSKLRSDKLEQLGI